jgi:predicted extracellular nuclease
MASCYRTQLTNICSHTHTHTRRYDFGNFEVIPTEPFSVATASSLVATTTTLSGDANSLLIGTYNVMNLDPNDNDGDTDVADGRFQANARIIAVNMNGPDVVALQEIQDNSGSTDDGIVSASDTLSALVAAITSIDSTLKYEFIDNTFIGDNTNGGEPGANIRTAYLYNPARVSLDTSSINTVVDPTDQQTDSTNSFFGSRLPLAATFTFLPTGYVFEMVNNHWSSKGGSAAVVGTAQPYEDLQEDPTVNGNLKERRAQSAEIKTYIIGKGNVIVVGDFNEFEFVSPVASLGDEMMSILTQSIPVNERYSYIFQGNSQSLDHILVSAGIDAVAEYVHVNSEFAHSPARASDHDPMVALIQVVTNGPPPPQVPLTELPAGAAASLSTKSPASTQPPPAAAAAAAPPTTKQSRHDVRRGGVTTFAIAAVTVLTAAIIIVVGILSSRKQRLGQHYGVGATVDPGAFLASSGLT